jgi:hypothetical protein
MPEIRIHPPYRDHGWLIYVQSGPEGPTKESLEHAHRVVFKGSNPLKQQAFSKDDGTWLMVELPSTTKAQQMGEFVFGLAALEHKR